MADSYPIPQTPGPWHVVPDEGAGAWLCAEGGLPVGYFEHVADAYFICGIVQGALAAPAEDAALREDL